jgi:hypothetical protein
VGCRVVFCTFSDLSLFLLNIMKRSSPASFEKKHSFADDIYVHFIILLIEKYS